MTTARKPPQPPTPRQTRPLAQPKPQARPLTTELMSRLKAIRDGSEGKITNETLAKELEKTKQEIAEWLGSYRSAPNSETTIAFILFGLTHDKNLLKGLQ